jgi:hypothetical protein
MLGDFLYQLSPRDQQSQGIVPIQRFASVADTAVTSSLNIFSVPFDQLFFPTAWRALSIPSGGESLVAIGWQAQKTGSSNEFFRFDDFYASPVFSGPFARTGIQTGIMFVPPGWDVLVAFQKSAGVASASYTAQLYGYLVPRGNIGLP